LMKAKDATARDIHRLVDSNKSIDTEKLYQTGYVIKQADHLEGCFVLEKMENNTLWLRQMFVTKEAVISLPGLLEAVLALAKNEEADNVIIHSHQVELDIVLEALQFFPQTDATYVDNSVDIPGKWWAYKVS